MDHLTKEQIQALLRIEGKDPSWFGNFELFVKGFGKNMEVSIALGNNKSDDLSARTVQTINEIANLTENHYKHILRLVFDDAMTLKDELGWGEPTPSPKPSPANWLRRLFSGPGNYRYVELSMDDPRHPLFGINTPEDIPARIKWEGFYVDDDQETPERIAFLTCHPPWEMEHGREIAIRDGVPVGIDGIQLNPYAYVQRWYDDPVQEEIRIRIWSGFHSLSDVLEMIAESDEPDVDREKIEAFARSEYRAKRDAEANWPPVTDCMLLDEVFNSLNCNGIIALHNAGYTLSDGISEVSEALARHDSAEVKGYCFYHEQDVARAVDGHGLSLAFGNIADTESGKRQIGERVTAEFERRGFIVEWDGNPETRVNLPKIVWRRRTPDDE